MGCCCCLSSHGEISCIINLLNYVVWESYFVQCRISGFLLPVKGVKGFSFHGKICQMFHIIKLGKKKHPASYIYVRVTSSLYFCSSPSGKLCDHTTFRWRCCGWLAVVGNSSMSRCNYVQKESKGEEKFNKEWWRSFER